MLRVRVCGRVKWSVSRAAGGDSGRPLIRIATFGAQSREFLGRAVRFLSGLGIRHFLDIGTGLPTRDSVHQVARRLVPAPQATHGPAFVGGVARKAPNPR